MKEQLVKYLKEQKKLLDEKEVDHIYLKNVYPSLLEEVFGELEIDDTNGWEVDYWFFNDEYRVFGTMYNGTATIHRRENDE